MLSFWTVHILGYSQTGSPFHWITQEVFQSVPWAATNLWRDQTWNWLCSSPRPAGQYQNVTMAYTTAKKLLLQPESTQRDPRLASGVLEPGYRFGARILSWIIKWRISLHVMQLTLLGPQSHEHAEENITNMLSVVEMAIRCSETYPVTSIATLSNKFDDNNSPQK